MYTVNDDDLRNDSYDYLDPLSSPHQAYADSISLSNGVSLNTLTAPVIPIPNSWQAVQLSECIGEDKLRIDPGIIREALVEDETLKKDFINILLENMKDEEAYNLVLKFFRTYFERMMDNPEDLYIKIKELKDENKALKEELDFWKNMYEPQTE